MDSKTPSYLFKHIMQKHAFQFCTERPAKRPTLAPPPTAAFLLNVTASPVPSERLRFLWNNLGAFNFHFWALRLTPVPDRLTFFVSTPGSLCQARVTLYGMNTTRGSHRWWVETLPRWISCVLIREGFFHLLTRCFMRPHCNVYLHFTFTVFLKIF